MQNWRAMAVQNRKHIKWSSDKVLVYRCSWYLWQWVLIKSELCSQLRNQVTSTGVGTGWDPFKVEDLSIVYCASLVPIAVTNAKFGDNAVQTEIIERIPILTEDNFLRWKPIKGIGYRCSWYSGVDAISRALPAILRPGNDYRSWNRWGSLSKWRPFHCYCQALEQMGGDACKIGGQCGSDGNILSGVTISIGYGCSWVQWNGLINRC